MSVSRPADSKDIGLSYIIHSLNNMFDFYLNNYVKFLNNVHVKSRFIQTVFSNPNWYPIQGVQAADTSWILSNNV